ncbi:hypothetical protein [Amycolatopsis sp. NPDC051102]|uniref:hypothetical protein n=1 Tax=Amycolatopsis sp. NPDC051102 TaxID=3155163 RepID=UPI00343C371E
MAKTVRIAWALGVATTISLAVGGFSAAAPVANAQPGRQVENCQEWLDRYSSGDVGSSICYDKAQRVGVLCSDGNWYFGPWVQPNIWSYRACPRSAPHAELVAWDTPD